MDNNELDKRLKEKLKNKIQPPKEFENMVLKTIQEQQLKAEKIKFEKINQNLNKNDSKSYFGYWSKRLISVAAMFVVVFTAGVLYTKNGQINDLFSDNNIQTVTIRAIEPTKLQSGILANDSEFLVYPEEDNASIEAVRKSLYIEPALEYNITKTNNKNEFKVTFKQNVPDNTIIKLQYVKNQIVEESWAYQTSNKLSITKTYPANNSNTVSINSIISIELSYANVENFEKNVKITPEINGTWEHKGKVWNFIPEKGLNKDTNYIVTINKELKADKQTLEDNFSLKFATFEDGLNNNTYIPISKTYDEISTFKSNEQIKLYYHTFGNNNENDKVEKVIVSKFNTQEDFINYLTTKTYNNIKDSENIKFEKHIEQTKNGIENEYKHITFNKNLSNGYYVASIQTRNNKELFNCPIQINDLSVYAMETERDVLAWVAQDGNLAKDIKVEYEGKEEKTDKDGIATFKDITTGEKNIKYMKVGNDENKLIVGVYNYNHQVYPNSYIYTDRPLYKSTDTINIWGFVPVKEFYDKIEDDFSIQLGNEEKQKITIEKDGNLNYKIQLNNHIEDTYPLRLYYKNTEIAYRQIEIKNYELQNYNYEIKLNKNYAYNGEKIDFDVEVTHITGIKVANKSVVIKFLDKEYHEKTDENGIVHMSINININEPEYGYINYNDISVYNGDSEEYTIDETRSIFYVLFRNVGSEINDENKEITIKLHKLSQNKDISIEDISKLYESTYDTNIELDLKEVENTRTIQGYEIDEYTNENKPIYDWISTENTTKIKDVNTNNGEIKYNYSNLNFKNNSEEKNYTYELILKYKDSNGKEMVESTYLYNELGDIKEISQIGRYYCNENSDSRYENGIIDDSSYNTYRYLLEYEKFKFSINDTVKLNLKESTSQGLEDRKNEGKILRIVFKEGINSKDIIESNNLDYTFTDKDFPGCKLTSAYFKDGIFYRMPVYFFDFNEEDRKVDVDIKSDKEKYQPGDEVTLTISTKNNGQPIKSFVNVSVVNEAVFNLIELDLTNIAEEIYKDKELASYTYSSFNDFLYQVPAGGAGGGGENRIKFGDTAHFETVYTNSNGEAIVKFKLPDNVTTYRVTAHAANEDMCVGVGNIDITSTLDFFIQTTEPRKVKTSDDLVLNATSIAEADYKVNYEFTIKELNKTMKITENTNKIATANFGKLKAGKYHAIITGTHENQKDGIEYDFEIIESAQEAFTKETFDLNDKNTQIKPSKNPIVLELYNKKTEQYIKYIDFIEKTCSPRLETIIAYNEIQKIKNQYYKTEYPINVFNINEYINSSDDEQLNNRRFKNLKNGQDSLLLTALMEYFAKEYCTNLPVNLQKDDNLFEYYLYLAANNEPILQDLIYLKSAQKDINNYNKLILTLSFEFIGDYQNAKDIYSNINLNDEEKNNYAAIIALIDTFINKKEASAKINKIIESNPSDEYLRFAILSFFANNSKDIEKEETVSISSNNLNETITINGLEVKKYTIYNDDLDTINLNSSSNDIKVSYYYQTALENINNENIQKDINIDLKGNIKKNNIVYLNISFKDTSESEVKITLPNSLRLAQVDNEYDMIEKQKYYVSTNNIDNISIHKLKGCKTIKLSLIVTAEGKYNFESIVDLIEGTYHISNSLDFTVTK